MWGVEKADEKKLLGRVMFETQERGIIKRNISERQDGMVPHCTYDFSRKVAVLTSISSVREKA